MYPKILFGVSLIIGLLIIIGVVLAVGMLLWNNLLTITPALTKSAVPIEQQVTITTDKTEYEQGEVIKLSVRNNLDESICFESCNTYCFQKKNVVWREYLMKMCEVNFITECINSSEIKEFKIKLSEVDFEKGVYKIAVPIYKGCQNKEFPCEESKRIYSNEFTIKEKKDTIIPKDKESCEAQGGIWGKVGLSSEEVCNLPTSDAGKECSDSDECEGSCIAELSEEDWDKAEQGIVVYTKGKCTAWKITVGCSAFVENGKVEGILCVD